MFYCTNVQFYPSIFNVSLNLCTSVQKYMCIPDCTLKSVRLLKLTWWSKCGVCNLSDLLEY